MCDKDDKEKLVSIERLTRDLAKAADTLTPDEARFLVDAYYSMQHDRIRAYNQVRALGEATEPHSVLAWLAEQSSTLEKQVQRALDKYSMSQPLGEWARGVLGIGPVIAAGLLAHIDIKKATTAGHIWRYAGLDSTVKWAGSDACAAWLKAQDCDDLDELLVKAANHWGRRPETLRRLATTEHKTGTQVPLTLPRLATALARRPFNADLKTLCWKIGESFIKVKGKADDVYGKLYEERKAHEHSRNERGDYRDQALQIAKDRPTHAQRKTYLTGALPDGHVHARAKRYAVKLFLAHYWEIGRELAGLPVVLPYPIAHLGHAHKIEPKR